MFCANPAHTRIETDFGSTVDVTNGEANNAGKPTTFGQPGVNFMPFRISVEWSSEHKMFGSRNMTHITDM